MVIAWDFTCDLIHSRIDLPFLSLSDYWQFCFPNNLKTSNGSVKFNTWNQKFNEGLIL